MAALHYLITGGAGFIGSHLTRILLADGHSVTVIDDLSTGQFGNIEPFVGRPGFRFVIDTIANATVLDRLASEAQVVVHLAAAVGVQLIVEQPVHTIETNVMGTEGVLKAARRYRAKVLLASTSEVYGKGTKIPFSEEDDVLLGSMAKSRWSYAVSKMVDECLGLAYFREMGQPVVITRLFNTVGAGQTGRYGMVVPRFVRQALAGEDLSVYGDGNQQRCFCDVRDVVRALQSLSVKEDAVGEVINVGGGEEISMLDLAKRVIGRCGSSSRIQLVSYNDAYAPGFEDMQRRVPDTSKVRRLIGWTPQYSLDEIIDSVVQYEREVRSERVGEDRRER